MYPDNLPDARNAKMPSHPQPVRIDGIKLSDVLVLADFKGRSGSTEPFSRFFRRLRQNRINLSFITTRSFGGRFHISCCAASEDESRLRALLTPGTDFEGTVTVTTAVGLVSLFPHQSDFQLPGICLSALAAASIPVYGFTTSLSAFTVVTDYKRLDAAVAAIKAHVDLPHGYEPMKPEFRIKQTAPGKGFS
jgi:aspartokinase